jgi:class 3 adenylate cyclase
MFQFLSKLRTQFIGLLYQHTVVILSLFCGIGILAALLNMSHVSSHMMREQALQNASLYAQTLKTARTLYSSEVVSKITENETIKVTHNHINIDNAIPLPATYLIKMSEEISQLKPDLSIRLYSDYPFPWRQETGGPQDEFETEALQALKQNQNQPFYRFESVNNRSTFRYAQADILQPSCIECHNTYPGSPKTDWKVGDVRGILEITQPLDSMTKHLKHGLRETSLLLVGLSILALSGLGLVISRLRRTSKELEQKVFERTAALQESNSKLTDEQEKSEQLLLSILPETIAQRLKDGERQIADGFTEATILFADIVGFTPLSEKVEPQILVRMLNEIFSAFDTLCDQYNLEKIKTIGDAYMVVGGLPNPCENHTDLIAEMALAMQKEVILFNTRHHTEINIRIGINTGPVVAGVIGKKKFIYDLWGDAVNTASRMESHGIAGQIQVTETVYEILKNNFIFEQRGLIPVKGKGKMNTYLLKSRQPASVVV